MTKKVVYSPEDTVQNINDRYLESVKRTVREALEKIPEKDRIEALVKDDAIFRILFFCTNISNISLYYIINFKFYKKS